MTKGLDYWGPLGCMVLVLITIVFIPVIGAWAWIPLIAIGTFAAVMAIIRKNAQ